MRLQAKLLLVGILFASSLVNGGYASATLLTGTGTHLPLPATPNVEPTMANPTFTDDGTTFIGTWAAPANPAWVGTFTGNLPYPNSTGSGTTTFNFSNVGSAGTGFLPAGTFFNFGDVDAGSGSGEQFYLRAFDISLTLITTEWLTVPVATWGTIGASDPLAMPGWAWNSVANPSTYVIDGSTEAFPGNPQFTFALLSTVQIGKLEVVKNSTNYGFGLGAPTAAVPEPSSAALVGIALLGLLGFSLGGVDSVRQRRRRTRKSHQF